MNLSGMGRRRERVPVRLPGDLWRSHGGHEGPPDRATLRLAVSRKGLAIELIHPASLGAGLYVEEITTSLPHLKFPLDLSGGVPRFRHCRGRLERLVFSFQRFDLETWASTALAGLLGEAPPHLSVIPIEGGLSFGLSVDQKALAWSLTWAPLGADLCLIVSDARAMGIDSPALAMALMATDRLLGAWTQRSGALFRLLDAPRTIVSEIFLPAGARLPVTHGVVWTRVEVLPTSFRLVAEQGGLPLEVFPGAIRSLEVTEMLQRGDDALVQGEFDTAREVYLNALDRAPRQREIVLRLADLDRSIGGRTEAALSTLVTAIPAVDAGTLGGILLDTVADREGARTAFERAAAAELHPAMAALCLVEAATIVNSPAERAALLGAAIARSPLLRIARWRRLEALLALGNEQESLAEAQHLEASADGITAKVEVLLRAGRMMLARGMNFHAKTLLEKALRARPTSEEGQIHLAEALFHLGEHARAAEILGRTIAQTEANKESSPHARLLLAQILADGLHELPLAIARTRTIPSRCPEAPLARLLEARCLAQLGEITEASLAFASLREELEQGRATTPAEAAQWLLEAAHFEEESRADFGTAKHHLTIALRLRPQDPAILAAFRHVAEAHEQELEALRTPTPLLTPLPAAPPSVHSTPPESPSFSNPFALDEEEFSGTAEEEARAAQLTEQVKADPSNLEAVLELAALLEKLKRDLDLFALLSARLEEGDEETRETLQPLHQAALQRLADTARSEGREGEAELYEQMCKTFLPKLGELFRRRNSCRSVRKFIPLAGQFPCDPLQFEGL